MKNCRGSRSSHGNAISREIRQEREQSRSNPRPGPVLGNWLLSTRPPLGVG